MGLYDAISASGLDPVEAGAACGLTRGVWFDEGDEVPLDGFVGVLEHVARQARDPRFGWRAGQSFDLRFLGELGEAVLTAPTLGAAYRTFVAYLGLVQTTTEIGFEIQGERAVLGYRILDPDIWPRCQDAEFTLSVLEHLLRTAVENTSGAVGVAFEHAEHCSGLVMHMECGYAGRTNAISFPARFLDVPVRASGVNGWQRKSRDLERAMLARNRNRPVTARTETAVLRSFGRRKPCQQSIAEELGMSPRSLHRHLKAEGTTFSHILADCRIRLTKHMLVHGEAPLGEIALELGFEDQSCLSRAFRRSTGLAPQSYRETGRGRG